MAYDHNRLVAAAEKALRAEPRLTLAELCRRLRIERHTLHRALAERGTNPRLLRTAARLSAATAALAVGPGASLGEIAHLAGFDSVSGFSRFVRRQTGASASHWRAGAG